MNETACAHSKVVLKHRDYPDGTRSDYWECDSGCGKQFFPDHTDMNVRNLRDYFAAAVLNGIHASYVEGYPDPGMSAKKAYENADAMLAERLKG